MLEQCMQQKCTAICALWEMGFEPQSVLTEGRPDSLGSVVNAA